MRVGRGSRARALRAALAAIVSVLLLSGCAQVVDGTLGAHPPAEAPNAHLNVAGGTDSGFDVTAQNALSDIMLFWRSAFPTISGGKPLQPLQGGLYSVDGLQVALTGKAPAVALKNKCIAQSSAFIVDNGAFCIADDSIAWDRAKTHLFNQLAEKYGDLMVAMIFAHEFGHAISYRLGIFGQAGIKTIDTESQADCAAGAWAAWALKGNAPHFQDATPQALDDAMEGYLNGRDSTPDTPQDVSHGNGFDRLSAVADGIDHGVTYCYSKNYFDRTFTERPYTSAADFQDQGNSPLADVLKPGSGNAFVADLNRFWTGAAKTINKTFQPVSIAEATHPPCDDSTIRFGYCPDTNTVYYDADFAHDVYYSLSAVEGNKTNGNVTIVENQPADFALGVMFSIGWGMAVRHQLFGRSLDGKDALTAAVCYSGSYAEDVNVPSDTPGKFITLSPSDLDEAVSSMLGEVGRSNAFGSRGTTGLDRIQDFVKGYKQGLSAC